MYSTHYWVGSRTRGMQTTISMRGKRDLTTMSYVKAIDEKVKDKKGNRRHGHKRSRK